MQPSESQQMFKQILSLSRKEILNVIDRAVTPHLSLLPESSFSIMFQMFSKAVRWSSMQADLLGLTLQMLDWKSLLRVSSVSKYYHLQVLKPSNWKYIEFVRSGKNELCRRFFGSVGRSLRFVRSLHFDNCRLNESAVIQFFVPMSQLRDLHLICFPAICPTLIEILIRCCPLLETLRLCSNSEIFKDDTLEAMKPSNNVTYILKCLNMLPYIAINAAYYCYCCLCRIRLFGHHYILYGLVVV
jgi:hypothetical protein